MIVRPETAAGVIAIVQPELANARVPQLGQTLEAVMPGAPEPIRYEVEGLRIVPVGTPLEVSDKRKGKRRWLKTPRVKVELKDRGRRVDFWFEDMVEGLPYLSFPGLLNP